MCTVSHISLRAAGMVTVLYVWNLREKQQLHMESEQQAQARESESDSAAVCLCAKYFSSTPQSGLEGLGL